MPQAYLRGKTVAERFYYDYSDEEIGEVAERVKKLAREARPVHVIFNNNALDFAPHAALRLRAALGQIVNAAGAPGRTFSLGKRRHGSGNFRQTRSLGAFSKLVGPCPFSSRHDRGHAAFDRARGGDRDFLWFHPALESEDSALDCGGVALQEQQDRGRDQRPVARSDPAVHAGDLSLGIQVWLLGDARSAAAAAPFSGLWVSATMPIGRHSFPSAARCSSARSSLACHRRRSFILSAAAWLRATGPRERRRRGRKFSRRRHESCIIETVPLAASRRWRPAVPKLMKSLPSSPPVCCSAPAPIWSSRRPTSRTPGRAPVHVDAKDFGSVRYYNQLRSGRGQSLRDLHPAVLHRLRRFPR